MYVNSLAHFLRRVFALSALTVALAVCTFAQPWETMHLELREVLAKLAEEHFGTPSGKPVPELQLENPRETPGRPAVIVVGFTGGQENEDSKVSGIVSLHGYLRRDFGARPDLVALVYNHADWAQAAERIVEISRSDRAEVSRFPQPLILVYGHSLGAAAIPRLAQQLGLQGLEISLAVFIDSFGFRNPRLPKNIRHAVNFYQRAGLLAGLPIRGKRKLKPEDLEKTQALGSYRVEPQTARFGWSWNLLQPLLYRQHHRLAHDARFQKYMQGAISFGLQLYDPDYRRPSQAPVRGLFERVVILGASVSAGEKAASPGHVLARHMGTPEEEVFVFARGGAESEKLVGYLENVAALKPTLIIGLDLFYHDFKFSLFLSESKKKYLRDFIRRLHDTGAVIALGNIPDLVLLRYEHANRYLESLLPEFPNLILLDVQTLNEKLNEGEMTVMIGSRERVLDKEDLFVDREHVNDLGSALLAGVILEHLRKRLPERISPTVSPVPLAPLLE